MKKTLTSAALAGILVLGGASAATAAEYPVDEPGIVVSDTTPAVGEPITITVTVPDGISDVTFSITGAPAGSTLASTVYAASNTVDLSVDKSVSDNTASAVFTPSAEGTFRVTVTAPGMDPQFIDIVVGAGSGNDDGNSDGSDDLATTGGDVPAGVIWAGVGALGLGGLAVGAAAMRRRANSSN